MISANNITLRVGKKALFEDVNIKFTEGNCYGLIGANGAGKSTFLKILSGQLEPTKGDIVITPGQRLSFLQQDHFKYDAYTVLDTVIMGNLRLYEIMKEKEAIYAKEDFTDEDGIRASELEGEFAEMNGWEAESDAATLLNGLGIDTEFHYAQMADLTGSMKVKVLLAQALFGNPDILLLDEPTNHLDLHATEWLEAYIQKFRGTVVAISHDRYFLDRSVNRVIEIENGKAEFYSGNYSFYAVEKERRYQERMKQYEKEQAKIAQLEKSAEQLRMWAFQGMDKTYRRAISMERRIERMRTTAKPTKARKMDARFTAAEFHGDEVLGIRNLSKAYGEKPLFEGISLKVEGGERIALIGDNGTGKSTLIKMIVDEVYPDSGRIRLGPQVKLAYLPQIIHFDHPDWNLVENMMAAKRGISAQSARNRLAAYDFRGEDVLKPVSVLSGGEQSRLRLCMLMDDEINFLILDEPTNHLDIASREWIEEAVEAYDGTLLFVSHDRYFINRFATRIWEVANGTITDYPMGFAQYRQVKAQEEAEKTEAPKPVKEKTVTEKPVRGDRAQQAARRQLTICEREIAKAEERIGALDAEMEANACDYEKLNALVADKDAAQAELDALYLRWEELSEAAGEA